MNVETFLENFSHVANTPDGINRLRRMIHDLAFQGLLVPQSGKESASKFLEHLAAAKEELLRFGIANRNTPTENQTPLYLVPNNWEWTNLEQLSVNIHYGVTTKAIHGREGVRLLRITDIQNDRVDWESVPGCDIDDKQLESGSLSDGDLLIARTGGTIGKTYLVENLSVRAVFASYLIRLIPLPSLNSQFIKLFTLSSVYWRQLLDASSGTGQPNVNATALKALQIPIPPPEEQKRIVSKVDELMKLCDELERQQQERSRLFPLLSHASHARLAAHPTPTNLAAIFTDPPTLSPDDMRKTIRSLAVRGVLAPQDSTEETVELTLERINARRKEVGSKDFRDVTTEDAFYEIPNSWRWTRLGNISLSSDSGWSPQCGDTQRTGLDWGVLKVSAVTWGRFLHDENKALPPNLEPRLECEVKDGDFLLSRANTAELVARSVIADSPPRHLMMSDKIVRFQLPDEINKEYVNLFNSSSWARDYYAKNASGTSSSMKNVGRKVMSELPIPLPPLAEQNRIVTRVNQLLAMIDDLEARQSKANQVAESFAQGAVTAIAGSTIESMTN